MPDTNDGAVGSSEDTEVQPTSGDPLPGFADAMANGFPAESSRGEPEVKSAVETSAKEEAPEPKSETPEKDTDKAEEKPDPTATVNFDGFSDQQKAYWDKALKAGHATPADVEEHRKGVLLLSSWSRNHGKLAKEREAFEKERADWREDYERLKKIRGSDRLHAAWIKVANGEVDDESGDEIADRKTAKQIAAETYAEREAEKAKQDEAKVRSYEAKKVSLQEVARDQMAALGVKPEVMAKYCEEEEAACNGADPIEVLSPAEFARNLVARHEKATLAAEVAALKKQLSEKVTKQVQASKQSLSPSPRVADTRNEDPWSKTLRELNVPADMGNVTGIGWQNGSR